MKTSPILLILLLIFSCQPKEKHVVSKTFSEKLVFQIHPSIDTLSAIEKEKTANQILTDDPSNYLALIIKSVNAINSNNTKSAIGYFRTLIKHNEVDPYVFVLLSLCYERENLVDSARKAQELALKEYYQIGEFSGNIAKLEAIINGKEKAFEYLKENSRQLTSDLNHEILKNDINNYKDQGLLEFFPVYFDDLLTGNYEIRNEELDELGVAESEIEAFFIKKGVDVMVYEVNLEEKYSRIKTIDKYTSTIEKIKVLQIKRR
jgi:tetratricopeptide (TPR) repeat protein